MEADVIVTEGALHSFLSSRQPQQSDTHWRTLQEYSCQRDAISMLGSSCHSVLCFEIQAVPQDG